MLKANPNLVDESWPDEIVIINLKKGFYYSLRGSGIAIWPLLKQGTTEAIIAEFLEQRYTGDLKGAVSTFLDQMKSAELLLETDQPCAPFIPSPSGMDKGAFVPPIFEIFTEMEDLLQLDPIHDTNEAGWPHQPVP